MILRRRRRPKVFGVGRNKTGTTSLGAALEELGFALGEQAAAELLLEDWGRRDFRRIIAHCESADAFKDIPFSLPYTYQTVDATFPGSRFILTVRDDAERWYESLTRFHTRIVGKGRLPTAGDLKDFGYRYRGWLWRNHELIYGATETTLYDKETYMGHYDLHNRQVLDYFRHRPGDLLVLNIAEPAAMERLCAFLGVPTAGRSMPHLKPGE
jgi:Sulfotransferase domain